MPHISVGIIAFGIWIVAGTIAAGSPLAWALMGLLTVIVGRPDQDPRGRSLDIFESPAKGTRRRVKCFPQKRGS